MEGGLAVGEWVGLCVLCVCACKVDQGGIYTYRDYVPHSLLGRMCGGSSLLSRLFILHWQLH